MNFYLRQGRAVWAVATSGPFSGSGWTYIDYEPELSRALEEAHSMRGAGVVTFSHGKVSYEVDIGRMTQTNKETGTKRAVRRLTIDGDTLEATHRMQLEMLAKQATFKGTQVPVENITVNAARRPSAESRAEQ